MTRVEFIADIIQTGLWTYDIAKSIKFEKTDLSELKEDVQIMDSIRLVTPEKYYNAIKGNDGSSFNKLIFNKRNRTIVKVSLYLRGKDLYNKYSEKEVGQ